MCKPARYDVWSLLTWGDLAVEGQQQRGACLELTRGPPEPGNVPSVPGKADPDYKTWHRRRGSVASNRTVVYFPPFSDLAEELLWTNALKPEKAMAPYSSTLVWKIPWIEEPGRLQSMGSLRVRHDWATSLSRIGEGNGNPLSVLAWRIPGTEEPGGLPSMGSHRVGHDWCNLAAAPAAMLSNSCKMGMKALVKVPQCRPNRH